MARRKAKRTRVRKRTRSRTRSRVSTSRAIPSPVFIPDAAFLRAKLAQETARRLVAERALASELGIPFDDIERAREKQRVEVSRPRSPYFAAGPPKAFRVIDVAKSFGDAQAAVDFARANLIPPVEWADEVADEFDLDVHDLYEAYYDTDPAAQAAA